MADFKESAAAHRDYMEGVIRKIQEGDLQVTLKMYYDAMVHGYKHGREDEKNGKDTP